MHCFCPGGKFFFHAHYYVNSLVIAIHRLSKRAKMYERASVHDILIRDKIDDAKSTPQKSSGSKESHYSVNNHEP
jgi:hypothetical protein